MDKISDVTYSMEEYYNAKDENEILRKELVDLRVEYLFARNSEVRKELQNKIDKIRDNIEHNIHIITSYKYDKENERGIRK